MIDEAEKAELHCHLDGLLCPAYVGAVQTKGFCSGVDAGELCRLYPVKNLEDWFRLGEYFAPFVHGNGELLLKVLRLYLKDLAVQNVRYAEIMLCSFLGMEDDACISSCRNIRMSQTVRPILMWVISGRSVVAGIA